MQKSHMGFPAKETSCLPFHKLLRSPHVIGALCWLSHSEDLGLHLWGEKALGDVRCDVTGLALLHAGDAQKWEHSGRVVKCVRI